MIFLKEPNKDKIKRASFYLTNDGVHITKLHFPTDLKKLERLATEVDRIIDLEPIFDKFKDIKNIEYVDGIYVYEMEETKFLTLILSLYADLRREETAFGKKYIKNPEEIDKIAFEIARDLERFFLI